MIQPRIFTIRISQVDNIWWTGIVAYNPSALSCTLTVTPFRADGKGLSPQTISLQSYEKYIGLTESLNFPTETAWFRIQSSRPVTGFELFATHDGNQLGGYLSVGINGRQGIFAKKESLSDGWTGIAFVNTVNTGASVTLTAYDDSGNAVGSKTMKLLAYEKVVNYAEDLFTQDITKATYIVYSSDQEVVGFQLNGSSDGTMLDGLPGLK